MTSTLDRVEFPARINLNYLVEGRAGHVARIINAIALTDFNSKIVFMPEGEAIPHITLLMGQVQSREDLKCILAAVQRLSVKFSPIPYVLQRPYCPDPQSGYVFCDVSPQLQFRSHRRALWDEVGSHVQLGPHGDPENVSHVTLAHVAGCKSESLAQRSSFDELDTRTKTRVLQVCLTGSFGICTKVLRDFELRPSR